MRSLLFWLSFAFTAYAYFGYAVWLWLYVRIHPRPVIMRPVPFTASILIAARNEQINLPSKIENLYQLDIPQNRLQIIIASDGSTDNTPAILQQHAPRITPLILADSRGKALALNHAVTQATGDILVFLDARQSVDTNAVSELLQCFADPEVGAVSGELLLEAAPGASAGTALGIYWKIEKVVRKLESASGSVVGVTGAIYAIRRELFTPIPPGTVLDDVFVPMNVVRQGKRVVFQSTAIARDRIFEQKGKEFSRKVRTLTGNYQLLRIAPWLLSPRNPILFRFISHKMLRLLVPVFLLVMLIASALASGIFFKFIFALQIIFYLMAALGLLSAAARNIKPFAIASTFVMLNAAAAIAFYNFVTQKKNVWV